jgi:hypothetical protein
MAAFDYADFDLEITCIAEGKYRAQVVDSPAGQASIEFTRPFSEMELENFILKIGRTRTGVRRLDSPEMRAAESFGKKLFDAVFKDEVRECLTSSLHQVDREEISGLRIKLRLVDVPELANLPWEYLYHPALRRFIVLSSETPITRYVNLPRPVTPLKITGPLHLLVMVASPSDYPSLDVGGEKTKLTNALGDLERRGLIVIEWLEKGTLSALQQRLRKGPVHLFHFIGHGGWDEQVQDGVLLFENEQGRGHRVNASRLAAILHDHRSLRLIVLNACEGARNSPIDPFAGVATTLIQQGVPAILAMQFEITDRAAIQLAQVFYESLADGYPAEAALSEARKAIFASSNDVEWGTPVLYLRAPNGKLFDLTTVSSSREAEWLTTPSISPSASTSPSVSPSREAKRLAALKAEEELLAREKSEQEWLARVGEGFEPIPFESAEADRPYNYPLSPTGRVILGKEKIPFILLEHRSGQGHRVVEVQPKHVRGQVEKAIKPAEVRNVVALHVLLSAGDAHRTRGSERFEGKEIGRLMIRFYGDVGTQIVSLRLGIEIRDWVSGETRPGYNVVSTASHAEEVWQSLDHRHTLDMIRIEIDNGPKDILDLSIVADCLWLPESYKESFPSIRISGVTYQIAQTNLDQRLSEVAAGIVIAGTLDEQAEAKRLAALKAEEERIAHEKAEHDRLAKEQTEAKRLAVLKAEEERVAREKAERAARKKAAKEQRALQRAAAVAAFNQRLRKIFTRGRIFGGLIIFGLLAGLYVITNAAISWNNVAAFLRPRLPLRLLYYPLQLQVRPQHQLRLPHQLRLLLRLRQSLLRQFRPIRLLPNRAIHRLKHPL